MMVRCHINLKIVAVENKFIFDLHFVGWAEQGSRYWPALTQGQSRYWPALTQGLLRYWSALTQGLPQYWPALIQGQPRYWPALTQGQPRYWPALTQGQPRSESISGTTVVFKFEAQTWDLQNKKQDL